MFVLLFIKINHIFVLSKFLLLFLKRINKGEYYNILKNKQILSKGLRNTYISFI